jgi:upstream activation factor subunit UAF30
MPKKPSVKETEQVAAAAPVVAPLVDKKVRKPKATKVEAVAPVDTSVPVVDSAVEDVPLAEQSVEFLAKLQQISVSISALKAEYRALEKKWTREVKTAQKQTNRRKRKAGNRAPSGFVKPTKISDELASFLGKTKGTEMARTDVTREINTYIRENKLQDSSNGRKINPDKKLATLLKLKTTDELTYFNLQKYMSPHFAKAVKAEVAAPVVV